MASKVDLGLVIGPQGPKGDKGDKGDKGEPGSAANINIQKYRGLYITTQPNEKNIPITISNTTYQVNDILLIFINGLYVDETEYVLSNQTIILTQELSIVGTKVQFVIIRKEG